MEDEKKKKEKEKKSRTKKNKERMMMSPGERFLSDRSWSCAGSNRSSSQLTVWTCSQDFLRTHLHTSLVVPHRSVTRSPSRPALESMSRPPSEQVA